MAAPQPTYAQGYPQPGYVQPQPVMAPMTQPVPYNPTADSIKSLTGIAGIFGILMAVLMVVWGIWDLWTYMVWSSMMDAYGLAVYTGWVLTSLIISAIIKIVFFILGILFYMQCNKMKVMVDMGQYVEAKHKALIWAIIGIIFVLFIPGIILLVAYLKYDELMRPAIIIQQPVMQPQPVMVVQQAPQPQPVIVAPQPVVVAAQPAPAPAAPAPPPPTIVQPAPAAPPPTPAPVPPTAPATSAQKFCPSCGTASPGGAAFCVKCGNKFG